MVDMIEEDFPIEFLGNWVLTNKRVTFKQIENVSECPEPLIKRILEEGRESVPMSTREKLCRALYELSGVGGKDFWKRYPEKSSNSRQIDAYFARQYRKLRGVNKSRTKISDESRQLRAVSAVHKKLNKRIGEPIKLTPAKVALIEHVRPEKDLINVVCTPYIRSAIINGKRYHMPKNSGKKSIREYKRDVRDWFSDTLEVTWEQLDPFKPRTYKWNSKKRRFDALDELSQTETSKLVPSPKVTKKPLRQPKNTDRQFIPKVAKEKTGLFLRFKNLWKRKTRSLNISVLHPKKEVKGTEIFEEYKLSDHLNGKSQDVKTLFKSLREAIMSFDNGIVQEKIHKRIIVYKTAKNFCEIVVQTMGLLIFVDITKKEGLDDPRAITEDCSKKGRWGSGKTRIRLLPEGDVDYALSIIRQAYVTKL